MRRKFFVRKVVLGCLVCIVLTPGLQAQAFSKFQWKNRLLILLTPDLEDPVYKRQIRELHLDNEALKERKGLVYSVTPESIEKGVSGEQPKTLRHARIPGYDPASGFRLLLIGLDGGVKLRSDHFMSASELWAIIDAMPMRRAEMRKKSKFRQ